MPSAMNKNIMDPKNQDKFKKIISFHSDRQRRTLEILNSIFWNYAFEIFCFSEEHIIYDMSLDIEIILIFFWYKTLYKHAWNGKAK